MKTCIFIVGSPNAGKSSLVRALTGVRVEMIRKVKKLSGNTINALVILQSIGERKHDFPPAEFPKALEDEVKKKRGNAKKWSDYDLLICPIRAVFDDYGGDGSFEYIREARNKGFDVKVAGIEKDYENNDLSAELKKIIVLSKKEGMPYLSIDGSNDWSLEAQKLRLTFYPK